MTFVHFYYQRAEDETNLDGFTPHDKIRVDLQITSFMFLFEKLIEKIQEKETKLVFTFKEIKMEKSPDRIEVNNNLDFCCCSLLHCG